MFASLTATHWQAVLAGNPVLIDLQVAPLSIDRKTPPSRVVAKRIDPFTAKDVIRPPPGLPLSSH
jgi:hypothetical protein